MFFDMNIFLDGSWRIFNGQRPYTDFIIGTGPLHYYMIALFHFIFGFGKLSFLAHLVTIHSLVIAATFWMFYKKIPSWALALVTLLSTGCFYWHLAFPWYSQSAHFWGILAIASLVRTLPFSEKARTLRAAFICGVLSACALMTKQNIGVLYLALFMPVFLIQNPYRWRSFAVLLATTFLSVLLLFMLFVPSWKAFTDQVILGSSAHRMSLLQNFLDKPYLIFYNYYWVPAALVCVAVLVNPALRHWNLILLFLGVWGVGVVSTFTSGAIYQADNQLMGVYLGSAFLLLGSHKSILLKTIRMALAICTICLFLVYAKYGLELKGWSRPYFSLFLNAKVDPTGNYSLKSKPLTGWRMEKIQGMATDDLAAYIRKNVPESDSLLILTDMQILNALTGRPGYKGVTLAFADNDWPTPGAMQRQVHDTIVQNPPVWIVTHTGRVAFGTKTLEYLDLKEWLKQNYALAYRSGNYVLLRQIRS